MQAWGVVQTCPHKIMWCPTWPLRSPMHNFANHNKVWS
jgi:hypothetical protein